MRPHPKRAETDPDFPRAWGVCDHSGFVCNHADLEWEFEWRGTKLVNQKYLVHPDFIDDPQPQLRTIILPADPQPVLNARPENYDIDETPSTRVVEGGVTPEGQTTIARVVETYVGTPLPLRILDGDETVDQPNPP